MMKNIYHTLLIAKEYSWNIGTVPMNANGKVTGTIKLDNGEMISYNPTKMVRNPGIVWSTEVLLEVHAFAKINLLLLINLKIVIIRRWYLEITI